VYGIAKDESSDLKEGFLFGGLSPPNKKETVLSVLSGSGSPGQTWLIYMIEKYHAWKLLVRQVVAASRRG
jgi:hypothetical protein